MEKEKLLPPIVQTAEEMLQRYFFSNPCNCCFQILHFVPLHNICFVSFYQSSYHLMPSKMGDLQLFQQLTPSSVLCISFDHSYFIKLATNTFVQNTNSWRDRQPDQKIQLTRQRWRFCSWAVFCGRELFLRDSTPFFRCFFHQSILGSPKNGLLMVRLAVRLGRP